MSVSGEDSTVTTVTVVELAGGGARLCEGPRRKELNTGEVAPGHTRGLGLPWRPGGMSELNQLASENFRKEGRPFIKTKPTS